MFLYFSEVCGWAGMIIVLLAYALVSCNRMSSQKVPFQLLNLLGAAGLAINAYAHNAWPSFAVNIPWMAIAAVSLARMVRSASSRST